MTPLIRDARRIRFSQRTLFASAGGAHYFFVFVLLLTVGASVSDAASLHPSQDPNAKPSTEATPLQKAVHKKKVITEDDLAKPTKAISLKDLEGEENNPTCDLSCEAELRARMGFGPEREAEFQNLLTLARHEISDDRVWNSTLQSALDAAGGYCDIQRQVAKIVGKGVVSEYMRNNVHSQFAERERNFVSQYRNSAGLLTQRIQAVQHFAPFRSTIMQYQMNEATARVCPDYTLP